MKRKVVRTICLVSPCGVDLINAVDKSLFTQVLTILNNLSSELTQVWNRKKPLSGAEAREKKLEKFSPIKSSIGSYSSFFPRPF